MMPRIATLSRTTKETAVRCTLNLDGGGRADVATGVPFFDHLLDALARHGAFDLELHCTGDLAVDDHHSVEDCAIVLGECFAQALGDRVGVRRFGSAYAPLDEALARAVVDLSGRPFACLDMPWRRESIGGLSLENLPHALATMATHARLCLHVDVLRGDNDHHRAEAALKAVALALRAAVERIGDEVPSTKGVL
ncbi:MAG: imidazoleglycerol-phosphate dehydratase HisB [Planctomycetota bacterium]|jgi:imidazoleglycerol-phosphate dehydratase